MLSVEVARSLCFDPVQKIPQHQDKGAERSSKTRLQILLKLYGGL